MTVDAAEVRRIADGRADVAAGFQRGEPGRQRGGRAARGAARRPRQVPRVVGRAVDGVEALPVGEVERHVRLAEEHDAGPEQAVDGQRVPGRDVVVEGRHAPRRGQAGDVVRLLDGHGHAVQRAPHLAAGQRAVGGARPRARALEIPDDDRVQRAIVALDARQVEVEQLETAELLAADVGGEPPGRAERNVEHRGASWRLGYSFWAPPSLASCRSNAPRGR